MGHPGPLGKATPSCWLTSVSALAGVGPEVAAELEAHPDEASIFGLPESIKLGLGDFIFYRCA